MSEPNAMTKTFLLCAQSDRGFHQCALTIATGRNVASPADWEDVGNAIRDRVEEYNPLADADHIHGSLLLSAIQSIDWRHVGRIYIQMAS